MLDSVIIVLRETLEASLLVSFLFVYSSYFNIGKRWMLIALVLGLALSIVDASYMASISDWFDGVGQEIVAAIVLLIISMMIYFVNLVVLEGGSHKIAPKTLVILYTSIILLAISLEGAEILVFLQSTSRIDGNGYSNLLGSFLGLGIGLSAGAVSYYFLSQISKRGIIISWLLLALVSAGMASQSVSFLMQADVIDSTYPVWNSSDLVSETSITGQLLYSLIGYESTPTLKQLLVYFFYLVSPMLVYVYRNRSKLFLVRKVK